MTEEWRKIPGISNHYEVSSEGRARRLDRRFTTVGKSGKEISRVVPGRDLTPKLKHYCGKSRGKNPVIPIITESSGKCRSARLCVLVARAFHGCPYPPGDPVGRQHWRVMHLDGDVLNNRADNLRWIGGNTRADDRSQYERNLARLEELRREPVEDWVKRIWGDDPQEEAA